MKMEKIFSSFLNAQEVTTTWIQVTKEYKTQRSCNDKWKGNASYDILYPSAWDKIVETEMASNFWSWCFVLKSSIKRWSF
jgi:hypothetical protein